HILPNSMTPVVTFLPFRMSAAILALTSLDFLGLGVPPGTPSIGELLSQGKANLDAWWISVSTFIALVLTLLLLTFMGDALLGAAGAAEAGQRPRRPAAAVRARTAGHSRRRHRDDLPGADDGAEPAVRGRRPGRGGAGVQAGTEQAPGVAGRHRGARRHRHPR